MSMRKLFNISVLLSMSFFLGGNYVFGENVSEQNRMQFFLRDHGDLEIAEQFIDDLDQVLVSFAREHEQFTKNIGTKVESLYNEHKKNLKNFFGNSPEALEEERLFLIKLLELLDQEFNASLVETQILGGILVDLFDKHPDMRMVLDAFVVEFQDIYPPIKILHEKLNKGLNNIRFVRNQIEKIKEASEL